MQKLIKDYALGIPVDPDADHFTTINEAVAFADAALPAGDPIVVRLAPGKTHALAGGTLDIAAGRDVVIESPVNSENDPRRTVVDGNLVVADADAEAVKRLLVISGVELIGDVEIGPNWVVSMQNGRPGGDFSITNGTGEVKLFFIGCRSEIPGLGTITFADAGGEVYFVNSQMDLSMNGNAFLTCVESCNFYVWNSTVAAVIMGTASYLVDWAGGATNQVYWQNAHLHVLKADPTHTFELYHDPAGNCQTYSYSMSVFIEAFSDIDLISGTHQEFGQPHITTGPYANRPAILNPGVGVEWIDEITNEKLVWDGTYWDAGGGVKRHEIVLDVGGAAGDHDAGWAPPAGAAVIKASCRLLKALTLAGGATAVGHGTKAAGDPDKYGETASGASGQTCEEINASAWPDGGGDDMAISSTNGAGAAAGTVAGSGDADVRLMYWFAMPTVLTE